MDVIAEVEREEIEGMKIETIHITAKGTEIKRAYPESTKCCPCCFNERLMLLRTLNLKFCTDCNTEIQWGLAPGQKTLA